MKSWKKMRLWLAGALVLCVIALFAVYFLEAWSAHRSRLADEGEGFAPADADEAEHMMQKEVEAGRKNTEPGTFAFPFRVDAPEDACFFRCLDVAVAPGLEVELYSADGKKCVTKTGEPFLWKGEALMLPVTPLEKANDCGSGEHAEIAVFGTMKPADFAWIDLKPADARDAKTLAAFAKDQKLKDKLIEGSSGAEGTLILTDSIVPLPPLTGTLDVPEGKIALSTARWTEMREDGTPDEPRLGPTEYALGADKPKLLTDNGLFCTEVLGAFRMNGRVYLYESEAGCDSGLQCRGILMWDKTTFKISYGNCNFST